MQLIRRFRKYLIGLGCILIVLFSASIADSLLMGPRCVKCHHPLKVFNTIDDDWIAKTIWQCSGCRRYTVEHFHKKGLDANTRERN